MMNDEMKGAVDSLAAPTDPSIFVASNGLRLKLRKVSQMIMTDAARRLKAPRPPKAFIDAKGREEENINDPEYIEAVRNYRYDTASLAVNTYFILGTQLLDDLPEGVAPVSDDSWAEMLRIVDPEVDIPTTGPRRYLAWLKYHALGDEDQSALLRQCVRFSGGTLEADVATAQATFRDNEARDTANGVSATDQGVSGNLVGADSGNGARV